MASWSRFAKEFGSRLNCQIMNFGSLLRGRTTHNSLLATALVGNDLAQQLASTRSSLPKTQASCGQDPAESDRHKLRHYMPLSAVAICRSLLMGLVVNAAQGLSGGGSPKLPGEAARTVVQRHSGPKVLLPTLNPIKPKPHS